MKTASRTRHQKTDDTRKVTLTLQRGLELLRAFRNEQIPLSNLEITERTHLPKSTVSRFTATLVSLRYLVRLNYRGRFQVGASALSLGNAWLQASEIRRVCRPLMQSLAQELNVSVGLAVPDRLDMLYIIWCASPKLMTLRFAAGTRLPMEITAVGKAYLLAQPAARRRELLSAIKKAQPTRIKAVTEGIKRASVELDRYGYCTSIAEFQKNTFGIAAPIVFEDPNMGMSLSCGGAMLRLNKSYLHNKVAPALLRTAARLHMSVSDIASTHKGFA